MKDQELNELLSQAAVPDRPADYWEEFPRFITRRLRAGHKAGLQRRARRLAPALIWAPGLAAVCLVIGFVIGFQNGHQSAPEDETQLAAMRKLLREVEALFPHQIQAIVLDEREPCLVLAETANLPASPPVYLRICTADRCQSFITFSGQRVRVNSGEFEVLTDSRGNVIVVGPDTAWSSSPGGGTKPVGRIAARVLEATL
jgi:hypothetical protein